MSRRVLVVAWSRWSCWPRSCGREAPLGAGKRQGPIVMRVASASNDDPRRPARRRRRLEAGHGQHATQGGALSECFEDKANKEKVLAGVNSVFPRGMVLGTATYGSFTHAGCTDADSYAWPGSVATGWTCRPRW